MAALLDGERIGRLAASRLQGYEVRGWRPVYARWKPGTSLLVRYDVHLVDALSGERLDTGAHARVYADGRAGRLVRSRGLVRLEDRAARRHGAPARRAFLLPELAAQVQLLPVDSALPALVRAACPRKARSLLGLPARPHVELVRYKPGRKALLRYVLPGTTLYAKVHAEGDSRRAALARELAGGGVPTPPPVAHVPDLGLVAFSEAVGERLADLCGTQLAAGFGLAAEALAGLHRVEGAGVVAAGREVEGLEAAAAAVGALLPHLAGRARNLAERIARSLGRAGPHLCLVHGDFYDDQVLVTPGGAVLLDFDEARAGHPLTDVGNALAHLSATGRRSPGDAFVHRYREAGGNRGETGPFEAAALLRLAVGPFRRLEPCWPERVERLLELAEERLPARRAAPAALLESASVSRALAATRIGAPDAVLATELVRHKPGRRTTARWDVLARGRPRRLYAKAYAGDRAPRVAETYRILHDACAVVVLPEPLGLVPESRLVVLAGVPGAPVAPRLVRGDVGLARRIAEALHALHACGAELPRRHVLAGELAPLAAGVALVEARRPDLGPVARACLERAGAASGRNWSWRLLPVHRDLYEEQVLAGAAGVAFVDLDDAAMSEPAVDVANLIAHLRLLALRRPGSAAQLDGCAAAFLGRSRELDPALELPLVRYLSGTTLLRLAAVHLPKPGGDELAPPLLAAAAAALGATRRAAPGAVGAGVPAPAPR